MNAQFSKILRQGSFILFTLLALYLIVSCIIAVPLMDENNNKNKEIANALKEELKSIRLVFNTHLADFQYDSATLKKYDIITASLKAASSSASLKNYLTLRLLNYKRTIENAGDLFVYKFNLQSADNEYKSAQRIKDFIIQQYKRNCDSAENELTKTHLAITSQINSVFAVLNMDTSANKNQTKDEYRKLNSYQFFNPLQIDYGKDLDMSQQRAGLFDDTNKTMKSAYFLSKELIKMNSSAIVIILGMLGVGFFGAVISLIRKNPDADNKLELVSKEIFTLVLVSVAASLITYLSLQGGITLITVGSNVNLNPYFILFVCFAASVFSEEIWTTVRNKISPSATTPPPPNPAPAPAHKTP